MTILGDQHNEDSTVKSAIEKSTAREEEIEA